MALASVSMASTTPRFPESHTYDRVLGPDTYDPKSPCAPLIQVKDRSRRTANFLSDMEQRPPIYNERTEPTVAPGTYDPSYRHTMPDVSRIEQFATLSSQVFASTIKRFENPTGMLEPPESYWRLEVDAKEWVCNRNGGGCWGKAKRDSGTLSCFMKHREEAAQLTSSIGVEEEGESHSPSRPASASAAEAPARAPTYVAPVMVPLDFCFKDLKACAELVHEEPLASFSGVLPSKITITPQAAGSKSFPADERALREKKKAKASSKGRAAADVEQEESPYRYIVNTVRLNNNLLTSTEGLPAVRRSDCGERMCWHACLCESQL